MIAFTIKMIDHGKKRIYLERSDNPLQVLTLGNENYSEIITATAGRDIIGASLQLEISEEDLLKYVPDNKFEIFPIQ